MQKLPADVTVHSPFNCPGCHAGAGSQGLLQQDSFHAAPCLGAGKTCASFNRRVMATSLGPPGHLCLLGLGCPEALLAKRSSPGVLAHDLMAGFCRGPWIQGASSPPCTAQGLESCSMGAAKPPPWVFDPLYIFGLYKTGYTFSNKDSYSSGFHTDDTRCMRTWMDSFIHVSAHRLQTRFLAGPQQRFRPSPGRTYSSGGGNGCINSRLPQSGMGCPTGAHCTGGLRCRR